MPRGLPSALRLYKWLSLAFVAVYVPLIVYDDFAFIEKIESFSDLGPFLAVELVWLLVYFSGSSFYYWLGAGVLIAGLSLRARSQPAPPSPEDAHTRVKAAPDAGNTPDRAG
jgi:hypothetical protein